MCVSLSSKKPLNLTENHPTRHASGALEVKLLR